jgi:3-phenylpropionate/trans-cinnamate dioxygenase ferredoxin subunit
VSESFVRVLAVSDVPPGTKKEIEVGGKSILVCNTGERWYAIAGLCSHANEKLDRGRMAKTWIACPVHGARFELATGKVLNPPAIKPIETYQVRITEDEIEVLV